MNNLNQGGDFSPLLEGSSKLNTNSNTSIAMMNNKNNGLSNNTNSTVVVLFGVCGCGKSTIGEALTNYLNSEFENQDNDKPCCFLEGDMFHSACNVEKMSKGIPLNDQDRRPWLLSIHLQIMNEIKHSNRKYVVVSCSALKNKYRELLVSGDFQLCENEEDVLDKPIQQKSNQDINWFFVNLSVSQNEVKDRLENRCSHFMNTSLIPSQFETLEITPMNTALGNVRLFVVDNQKEDVASVVRQIDQLIK